MGKIMCGLSRKRGIAGMAIDGAMRDVATLKRGTFPIYAHGFTHRRPYKNGLGEINVPVLIGGLVSS